MNRYPYTKTKSNIFEVVSRPLITIKIFSQTKNIWIPVYDTLADTGADISIIPAYLGRLVVGDITKSREIKIRGIVPYSELIAYIHNLRIEIAKKEIESPIAIADSDKIIPILGRVKGIDLFEFTYYKGKEVIIKNQ